MLTRIGHLLAYDVRSLRGPLPIWGLVLGCQAAVLLLGPDRLSVDVRSARVSYDSAAMIARLALTAIITALLVQRDSLVGTTAFWRTRPIPRPALLASKLASAIVLVVLAPFVVLLGVLLGLGLPVASAVQGAVVAAAEQVVFLTLALACAVVTANLAHFVIAAIASGTVVMLLNAVLPALVALWSGLRAGSLRFDLAVFMTGIVIGAVVATAHQYLTLRTWRSAALIAAALVGATIVAGQVRRAPLEFPARAVDPALLSPAAITVEAQSTGWNISTHVRNGVREPLWQLAARVTTAGEPDAILLRPDGVDATLLIAGRPEAHWGSRNPRGTVSSNAPATARNQPYRAIRATVGDVDLVLAPQARDRQYSIWLMNVSGEVAKRLKDEDSTLDATLTLRAFRYQVAARAPLAPGASLVMPSRSATIVSIGRPPAILATDSAREGVSVKLRDTRVVDLGGFMLVLPPSHFLLYNAGRRQAIFMAQMGGPSFRATLGLLSSHVLTSAFEIEFDATHGNAPFEVDEAWLGGAELLFLAPEELGIVTRPLRIEGLPSPGGAK